MREAGDVVVRCSGIRNSERADDHDRGTNEPVHGDRAHVAPAADRAATGRLRPAGPRHAGAPAADRLVLRRRHRLLRLAHDEGLRSFQAKRGSR